MPIKRKVLTADYELYLPHSPASFVQKLGQNSNRSLFARNLLYFSMTELAVITDFVKQAGKNNSALAKSKKIGKLILAIIAQFG